ncbi:hypothetical protein HanXRQr2_Chr01g0026111 [Helianthus annuus]|uniref:Uncharacterized protein n=1 Tax=Helianthus annuus TaxID=4232 RepID=A0A9K3JVT7_HELAN|nr:hypothetical protein HanXRQr2_Chr01g0026111 [Helianthus annuus]KAJ0957266.1 hypothetical protein HanPSC8_Chr01g0025221 [Helianthus annuus]
MTLCYVPGSGYDPEAMIRLGSVQSSQLARLPFTIRRRFIRTLDGFVISELEQAAK